MVLISRASACELLSALSHPTLSTAALASLPLGSRAVGADATVGHCPATVAATAAPAARADCVIIVCST